MESIMILSPFIPGLQKAVHQSFIENKPLKNCFKSSIKTKVKCFKCESTTNLKMIQVKSNSRCSDELIESHYFCKNCRNPS